MLPSRYTFYILHLYILFGAPLFWQCQCHSQRIKNISHLINNSDNDSNATVVRSFERFEADYAYEFENEFETQIRTELREEVAEKHSQELRKLQEELEYTKLKLSATRNQLLRAHIRIRAFQIQKYCSFSLFILNTCCCNYCCWAHHCIVLLRYIDY